MSDEGLSQQYPPNTIKDQRSREKPQPEARQKQAPVVEGTVIKRRKGFLRSARDFFKSEEFGAIGGYLVYDVALPAMRNLIFDIINNGSERVLYGVTGAAPRRVQDRGPGHMNYVNYSRRGGPDRVQDRRSLTPSARRTHDFGEIVLSSRVEADEVISALASLIDRYGQASVLDLYELVNIEPSFTDDKWGWTQMRTAAILPVRGGYLLDLPRPEALN